MSGGGKDAMEEAAAARRFVVIGGGISGLVAAWRLVNQLRPDRSPRERPVEVLVLESSPSVGGKLAVGEVGGVTVDVGAESMLARRPEGVALLKELGLDDDVVHPRAASASVLSRGTLYALPKGTVMGVPVDRTRLRGLAGILDEEEVARVGQESRREVLRVTEDIDVASWVTWRMGRAVVDRLVEPLLGGVYAGNADRLSLRATVPQLWQRARAGRPLLDPAAQPEAAAPQGPVFAGLRGGVGRLPLVLAQKIEDAGGDVRTGVTVRGLTRTERGWRIETGTRDAAATAPGFIDADGVILAVPAPAAAKLLAAEVPVAAAEFGQVETASVAVVAAAIGREQLDGLTGTGLLIPPVERRVIKAATFSSNKWKWVSDETREDNLVVRLSLGRAREETVLQRDDAELSDLAVAELRDVLRREVTPVATRVVRWGGALPQYEVGHLDRVHRIREAVAGVPGLAVCGAVFDGVGIPACIAAADRAVHDLDAGLRIDLRTLVNGPRG
ncbi:protoporphyrinogen oxidase [Kineosporia succinea]|uniref:Coproporphyrinogen III oxidase n=1 Tax=Kineosporia succinea TaxID=84632 RepID=A0ABT9NVR2_9ACTN|nr:protoporphyrinogen oxidase [Kineosporia succinea]MDP9824508.1 oxygen-dependent protoporphyrinogen oxidase [Kineosporia succinea]